MERTACHHLYGHKAIRDGLVQDVRTYKHEKRWTVEVKSFMVVPRTALVSSRSLTESSTSSSMQYVQQTPGNSITNFKTYKLESVSYQQ